MTDQNKLVTLDSIRAAHQIVAGQLHRTRVISSGKLDQRYGVSLYFKPEMFQKTGAFKVRGGLVYMDNLHRQNALPEGFITATRGNHGE